MRISIITVLMASVLFLSGCGTQNPSLQNENTAPNTGAIEGNTTIDNQETLSGDEVQDPLTNLSTGNSNVHTFFFEDTMQESVTMHHTAGEPTKVFFINADASSMRVSLAFPSGEGNLRLSQIIAPDGQMDGPFSVDTTYDLTQFGGYQLIFNENMMAGDPWSGDVIITVELTK